MTAQREKREKEKKAATKHCNKRKILKRHSNTLHTSLSKTSFPNRMKRCREEERERKREIYV